MSGGSPGYEELLAKLEALDPLLVEAIDEVDESLVEEFGRLSLEERVRRASEGARTLVGLEKR
ncbi:MAG: hypothetical protein R6V85_16510 [Polyangia bacterium]